MEKNATTKRMNAVILQTETKVGKFFLHTFSQTDDVVCGDSGVALLSGHWTTAC